MVLNSIDNPLISIITVNFNSGDQLLRTVDSIDSQDFQNFEHIIQDAWSTDESISRIQDNTSRGRREIFREEDLGVYDGMNKAMTKSKGEIVIFLNAGDVFANSNVLTLISDVYSRDPFIWAVGETATARTVSNNKNQQNYRLPNFRAVQLGFNIFPHPSTIYSRSLLKQLDGFAIKFGLAADQHYALRAYTIMPPRVLLFRISIFDESGLSSRQGKLKREMEFHAIRKDSNALIGGSVSLDVLVSTLLATLRIGKNVLYGRRRPHQ